MKRGVCLPQFWQTNLLCVLGMIPARKLERLFD
jgi:hypothetical protein